ncbi:hypothetical protein QBC38DRAFT_466108 [Podospora fimiseda]|uniref:Uncharacterized protein n=1 Tax=Podospora fimiseda TaxID=252190 RepID=A0AAN7BY77_9PEZI|nr:hypothetical protein QBC38DRAFT_466108 [Podospora fimiseda]
MVILFTPFILLGTLLHSVISTPLLHSSSLPDNPRPSPLNHNETIPPIPFSQTTNNTAIIALNSNNDDDEPPYPHDKPTCYIMSTGIQTQLQLFVSKHENYP